MNSTSLLSFTILANRHTGAPALRNDNKYISLLRNLEISKVVRKSRKFDGMKEL